MLNDTKVRAAKALQELDGVTRNTLESDPDADVPSRQVGVAGRGGSIETGDSEVVVVDNHDLALNGHVLKFDETDRDRGRSHQLAFILQPAQRKRIDLSSASRAERKGRLRPAVRH